MSYDNFRPAPFKILPPVVKNLLIINGIFFLATTILEQRGVQMYDTLGLHFFLSSKFKVYQLFTYMFMHGNFMHLLLNMFQLWMFGYAIENAWGQKKFLQFYLLCGLGAAAMQFIIGYIEYQPMISLVDAYLKAPGHDSFRALIESPEIRSYINPQALTSTGRLSDAYDPFMTYDAGTALTQSIDIVDSIRTNVLDSPLLVGASGAVFGILLAFGMTFPDILLYFYFFIPIKAKYAVIIFGVLEMFAGVANFTNDNVAHFAHIGGLITGFIIIMIWNRRKKKNQWNNFS